jgi:predicted Zn-dependent protease
LVRLHSALMNAGKEAEAANLARSWLKDHPQDIIVHAYLADRDLRSKEYESAARHYRAILDQSPNNAVALNNLAWTAARLNDPQALGLAEQANRLAPNNAAIMDTLGALLVESGETARGLELLERAAALAPGAPEIRLHLAQALAKSGRKDAARKEIEVLLKAADASPTKDEATALMKSL